MTTDGYLRRHDLPRLLPVWPADLAGTGPEARRRIVALLKRALRAERQRGIAGHWTYDLARHSQLLTAYREERRALGLRDEKIKVKPRRAYRSRRVPSPIFLARSERARA